MESEHDDTATRLNSLALSYKRQGKYMEAEPLYQQVLAIRKKQLGEEHPDTASSCYGLAGLYARGGKDVEAKSFYQRALAIYEQTLGPEHSTTRAIQAQYARFLQHLQQREP